MLNATFSNISAISWRPVLVVEEAGVPGETTDHGQATGKIYHLWLRVECTLFCNLQSRARAHAISLIGLYGLLGNPVTRINQDNLNIFLHSLSVSRINQWNLRLYDLIFNQKSLVISSNSICVIQ